jgi:hypothetical protein
MARIRLRGSTDERSGQAWWLYSRPNVGGHGPDRGYLCNVSSLIRLSGAIEDILMRTNDKRRREYARRRQLFEQLRLQADVLCMTHTEGKETVVLGRMMNIILDVIGERKLNSVTRQALANHFSDCLYDHGTNPTIKLGGTDERNMLHLDGQFDIADLAKRIVWTETRPHRTLDMEKG